MSREQMSEDQHALIDEAVKNGNCLVYPGSEGWNGTLTKRELFAAMIMQGLASNSIPGGHREAGRQAQEAVHKADALLKELAK